mmetsp:Transcript_6066/g.13698  ORF Transcript_6066/g.13698 Transcript_6066/m.13698 type:complete len:92 (-) Transcript_6066:2111-2386(-)
MIAWNASLQIFRKPITNGVPVSIFSPKQKSTPTPLEEGKAFVPFSDWESTKLHHFFTCKNNTRHLYFISHSQIMIRKILRESRPPIEMCEA